MDDMKRLIEKYKQELMEYGRADAARRAKSSPAAGAAPTAGSPSGNSGSAAVLPDNMTFPEMIEDNAEDTANTADTAPADTEETLDCQGKPVSEDGYEAPRRESDTAPDEDDFEELAPVSFGETSEKTAPARAPSEENTSARAAGSGDTPAPKRKPEVIGYVSEDNEGLFDYDSIFGDMMNEPRVSDRRVTAADAPRYDEISSQRGLAEENTADSTAEGNSDFAGEVSGVTDNSPREPRPDFAPAGSVSPEQAEQLSDRPINSRPSEQLTGRSFESSAAQPNSRGDIRPLHDGTAPADKPDGSPAYSNLQDFVPVDGFEDGGDRQYTNNFRFQVYTARNALPIEGASCIILKNKNGGSSVLFEQLTDSSGQTAPVALPAPSASLSQSPSNTVQPYALYDARVSADGFNTVEIKNIPVFEGILSVQRVAMIPQAEENITETIDEQDTEMNGGN